MRTHIDLVMVIAINFPGLEKKKVFAVWKYEGSLPEKEGFYSALNMKEYLIWSRTCKKCLENFEWISWFVDIKKNHYY